MNNQSGEDGTSTHSTYNNSITNPNTKHGKESETKKKCALEEGAVHEIPCGRNNTDGDDDGEGDRGLDDESTSKYSYEAYDEEEEEDEEYDYKYEADDYGIDHEEESIRDQFTAVVNKRLKEQSKETVSMSLRAEQEKVPGRRRLYSDISKIMMNADADAESGDDTLGFTMKQRDEDRMDMWTIQLHKFDNDADLSNDMAVLGLAHIKLQLDFPEQYPFEPPFVHVVTPHFKRGTGTVWDGALCMELLTKSGWSPAYSIESIIYSVQSHLVVSGGRIEAAAALSKKKYNKLLNIAKSGNETDSGVRARHQKLLNEEKIKLGTYSIKAAKQSFQQIENVHKKKGWSDSWKRKG